MRYARVSSKDLVNERGNLPRRGVVPRFSDLEVISLSLTAEYMSIDSEILLFDRLKDYYAEMPNLISRRQHNDRRKFTGELCEKNRKRIADRMEPRNTSVLTRNLSKSVALPEHQDARWELQIILLLLPWATVLRTCITSGINSTLSVG